MEYNAIERIQELYNEQEEMKDYADDLTSLNNIYEHVECILNEHLHDHNTLLVGLKYFPKYFKELPPEIRSISEIALQAVISDRENVVHLPLQLQNCQTFKQELFFKAAMGFKLDFEFLADEPILVNKILENISDDAYYYSYAPKALREDAGFNYKAAKQNGMILHFLPSQFKDDVELTKIALTQCGIALKYALPKFQSDLSLVLIAVTQNATAIRYAHPSIFYAEELDFLWKDPIWAAFKIKELEYFKQGRTKLLGMWH